MSKQKKELRAEKRAQREAQQGKKVVFYVAGALIVLFVLVFVGAALLG